MDDIIAELKKQDIIDNESQVNTETGDITTNEPTYIISDKLDEYVSNVKITISKTPETEPAEGVLLKVENVEGIEGIDLDNIDTTTMDESSKKELIKKLDLYEADNVWGDNYNSFEELLQDWYNGNEGEYWNGIKNDYGSLDNYISGLIGDIKNAGIEGTIKLCTITNPKGEISDLYVVFENGTYTFEVTDLNTGETYKKSVEVTNISTDVEYKIKNIGIYNEIIVLVDKNESPTVFEKAYIFINGEKIDITSCIYVDSIDGQTLEKYLRNLDKVPSGKVNGSTQIFEMVKDGKSYIGKAEISYPE